MVVRAHPHVASPARGTAQLLKWQLTAPRGFPGGSDGKDSAGKAGDPGSIPGVGRSPGEGHGNPLKYLAWRTRWIKELGGL